jgi:transcriptional regulator with XRE-family HTH domain
VDIDSPARERGQSIAATRFDLGLTQLELAQRLDVHEMTVWRWERNGAPLIAEYAVRYLARTLEPES